MTLKTCTPGPWFATDTTNDSGTLSGDRGGRGLGCWTVSTDPEKSGWWHDGGYAGYGVTEANARLMAAAPDLLEALIMVRDAWNDAVMDGISPFPVGSSAAEAKIWAAIAKATGE